MSTPVSETIEAPALIEPFINSVQTVVSTMAKLEVITGQLKPKTSPDSEYDYSGRIGFTGAFVGAVIVSFQKETASKVISGFAGCEIEPDTSDFADALGELANMVAGVAKKDLGGQTFISVPNVVMGRKHSGFRATDLTCWVIPCSSSAGEFSVEVTIMAA